MGACLRVPPQTGFVSIALVSVVFWGRVVVATDDRKKRETVKRRRRELLIKRISGMFRPGDEDALLVAGAWLATITFLFAPHECVLILLLTWSSTDETPV